MMAALFHISRGNFVKLYLTTPPSTHTHPLFIFYYFIVEPPGQVIMTLRYDTPSAPPIPAE